MQTVPMPLFTGVHKGVDDSVLTDVGAIQYNGYIDDLGGLNVRPGEATTATVISGGNSNNGMYYWPDNNLIVTVDGTTVYVRTIDAALTLGNTTAGSLTSYVTGGLNVFASDGTYVYMANGSRISYVDNIGTVAEISDADAPATATHVAYLDGYILAISGNNKFYWSDLNAGTTWSALSFASAEAAPDINRALHVVQRQIYILGTTTTEIWENDGETPFSRIPGGLIEIGCGAKYSGVKYQNSLIWLNENRKFVKFTGTAVEFLSGPYDKELAGFSTVSDCIGNYIYKDGQEYIIFQFPTENRTLVYHPINQEWSEWGTWDENTSTWDAYDIRSSATDLRTGEVFIGKANTNCITRLDSTSRNDILSATTTGSTSGVVYSPVRFLRRTGWIDNGTSKQKRLEILRFRAKSGDTASTTAQNLLLRYRNDGSNQWSNNINVNIGAIGQTEHHIKLRRLGIYRSRQFEISCGADTAVVLSNAEAEITVLR